MLWGKTSRPAPRVSTLVPFIEEEVGDRHEKTNQPKKWRCTSECNGITSEEKESILDSKLFSAACAQTEVWVE